MTQYEKNEMIQYLKEQRANKVSALPYLQGFVDVQNGVGEIINASPEELEDLVREYLNDIR